MAVLILQRPWRDIYIKQKPACNANQFFVTSDSPHGKNIDSWRGKVAISTQCFCTDMLGKSSSISTPLNSTACGQLKLNLGRRKASVQAAGRMGEQQVKQAGVLVTYNPISYLIETLEHKFTTYKLYEAHDREAFFAEHGQSIRGVVCGGHDGITAELIDALPSLEIVAVNGVGLDKVDLAKCRQRNIAVGNTPDVLTDDVADLAMSLMLDALRQISACDRYVRQGLWQSKGDYKLTCKTQTIFQCGGCRWVEKKGKICSLLNGSQRKGYLISSEKIFPNFGVAGCIATGAPSLWGSIILFHNVDGFSSRRVN